MKPTIVFTGGHHNSALVVALELKREGYQVVWIGHKFAAGGDKSVSAEYQEVTKNKIPFYELKTGKFYRQFNPFVHLKTFFGFFQAISYLIRIRPKLIVSFGGYLAVPVVISGWLLRIHSITHEQTVVSGWANRAIAPFVDKILLTHTSSLSNYPANKSLVVGLPLRPELFDPKLKRGFHPKLLYISCGKQGASLINKAVFSIVPELVKNFTVVHQTGSKDIDRANRVKGSLNEYSSRYQHAPYFFAREAATYLQSAAVVVSRAGAHLTYELSSLHKKSVFIPIPWVSHNEQFLNAKHALEITLGKILEEKDLNPQTLLAVIQEVDQLKQKSRVSIDPELATKKILNIIHGYFEN